MKGLSFALGKHGIDVLLLHPGWVKTRMGDADAQRQPGGGCSWQNP
jgi:NAD(P)-dependent dehydrogenase (short-subunit alcohol dehydrogenase family)